MPTYSLPCFVAFLILWEKTSEKLDKINDTTRVVAVQNRNHLPSPIDLTYPLEVKKIIFSLHILPTIAHAPSVDSTGNPAILN